MNEKKIGWVATETMAMKQKHYFLDDSGESLCGKLFNLDRKINTEVNKHCKECEKLLFQKTTKSGNVFEQNVTV